MFAIKNKLGAGVCGLLLSALAAMPAWAEEAVPEAVSQGVHKLFPTGKIDGIKSTPMAGLYEVTLGARLFYVSADGKYLMQGNLYDIEARENLTEASQTVIRQAKMAQVSEDQMLVFESETESAKHTVTVFTDIDCGYCRKLHNEMDAYNAAGIRVRYLFYPRSGPNTPSFDKAISVWCADDRNQAMTDAKTGKPVESRTCDNPVGDHYALGGAMGVTGTPAIVLDDGEILPGYVPADRLAKALNSRAQPAN